MSPYAKKLATEKGIDLSSVQGTGPNNRIIAADILEFKAQPVVSTAQKATTKAPEVAPKAETKKAELPDASAFIDIENAQIRKVVAERLTFSK